VLKRIAHKNHLSSVATLTTELQNASGSNVSTITVRWELHEMGFHGQVAAHQTYITMCNANHWTLEQWKHVLWSEESRFWQSNIQIWVW
jgi:hypothetical protein